MADIQSTPILLPYNPEDFWQNIRTIMREEVTRLENNESRSAEFQTSGLKYKPLYKMSEVCKLLQVTRPTIYDWIKKGKLVPYKIQSRVYFLWNDIQNILNPK